MDATGIDTRCAITGPQNYLDRLAPRRGKARETRINATHKLTPKADTRAPSEWEGTTSTKEDPALPKIHFKSGT
jgi:hypothetical protein